MIGSDVQKQLQAIVELNQHHPHSILLVRAAVPGAPQRDGLHAFSMLLV